MAEKVPIICPECAKQFEAPREIIGRKIRCKNCGKAFVATKAKEILGKKKPAAPPPAEGGPIPFKDDDDEDGDGKPYEVTSLDMAPRCPSCANELESEDDKICLHCGFNLESRTAAYTRRVKDVTGFDIFMWLLPGILAALFFLKCLGWILLVVIIRLFFWQWEEGSSQMWKNFINGLHLWWCICNLFLMYFSGKFAIKRLIFDNKPPEVEI